MDKQDIIDRLQNGWDLADRGTGWRLSAPRITDKQTECYQIEEATVKAMKAEGVIEFDWPYLVQCGPQACDHSTTLARLVKPSSEEL